MAKLKSMKRQRKSIALLIETSNSYARGVLRGIIDYQHQHQHWSIYLAESERGAPPPAWMRRWAGDGMIARIESDEIASAVKAMNIPVVDVSAARRLIGIPWVETDDSKIAELAIEHLLERGFQNFAYCGESFFNWSNWRRDRFLEAARQFGKQTFSYDAPNKSARGYSWVREQQRLGKWLQQLPKPVGLLANYDIQAQRVLDTCRLHELCVPDEIAVVGVDNDEIICNLASPTLTSIIPNAHGAGYLAAELLDKLMHGNTVAPEPHLLPPLGISLRKSSDVYAVEDPEVAEAAKFIRDHACEGINVLDVVKHLEVSRRALESRFRRATGKSPHQAIIQQRLARAAQLLRDTDWGLESIAHQSGFEHAEYMSVAFRREFQIPPSAYRKHHRK